MRASDSSRVKSGSLFSLPVFSRAWREGGSHLVGDVIAGPYIGVLCFPQAERGTPITVLLGCASLSAGHTTPPCCSGTGHLPALPEQRDTGAVRLESPFPSLSPQMGPLCPVLLPPPLAFSSVLGQAISFLIWMVKPHAFASSFVQAEIFPKGSDFEMQKPTRI